MISAERFKVGFIGANERTDIIDLFLLQDRDDNVTRNIPPDVMRVYESLSPDLKLTFLVVKGNDPVATDGVILIRCVDDLPQINDDTLYYCNPANDKSLEANQVLREKLYAVIAPAVLKFIRDKERRILTEFDAMLSGALSWNSFRELIDDDDIFTLVQENSNSIESFKIWNRCVKLFVGGRAERIKEMYLQHKPLIKPHRALRKWYKCENAPLSLLVEVLGHADTWKKVAYINQLKETGGEHLRNMIDVALTPVMFLYVPQVREKAITSLSAAICECDYLTIPLDALLRKYNNIPPEEPLREKIFTRALIEAAEQCNEFRHGRMWGELFTPL